MGQDRPDRHHLGALGPSRQQRLGHRDGELGIPRRDLGQTATLAGLHDGHVQARIGVKPFGFGQIEAAVVGVGRPVQHQGDLAVPVPIVAGPGRTAGGRALGVVASAGRSQ